MGAHAGAASLHGEPSIGFVRGSEKRRKWAAVVILKKKKKTRL
jgi:hypothetical protein